MKRWIRICIPAMVVICMAVVSGVAATRAQASTEPPSTIVNCQVYFSDGPNAGKTEPVTFHVWDAGGLAAYSDTYVGGVSTSGSWVLEKGNNVTFGFSAQLNTIPGASLAVKIAFPPFNTNPMVGPGVGTIVGSNGVVLVVTHTTTTCPAFAPPSCWLLACTFAVPPGDASPREVQVA